MPDFDLVLFDVDGTLVDTQQDVYISLNLALQEIGLPQISMHTAKLAIGPGPKDFMKFVLGEENLYRAQEFRAAFRPIYWERCADHAELFPGMTQLLDDLKEQNIKTGVATNKARFGTDVIFKALDVQKYFDIIMTRDEVEKPKPEPDMILTACKTMNVAPERTLMLGDTDNDLLAARSAGAKSCLALWGYANDMDRLEGLADFSVQHPLHLLHVIKKEIMQHV